MANVDRQLLRDVLARHASGVSVVTTRHDGRFHGLTVTSFCGVSLKPPLVLVCVDRLTRSDAAIAGSAIYAVNLIGWRQMALADRFAGRGPEVGPSFEEVPHHTAVTGAPILDGCLGWVDCRVWAVYDGGDHVIYVGHVEAASLGSDDNALAYLNRRYARFA